MYYKNIQGVSTEYLAYVSSHEKVSQDKVTSFQTTRVCLAVERIFSPFRVLYKYLGSFLKYNFIYFLYQSK